MNKSPSCDIEGELNCPEDCPEDSKTILGEELNGDESGLGKPICHNVGVPSKNTWHRINERMQSNNFSLKGVPMKDLAEEIFAKKYPIKTEADELILPNVDELFKDKSFTVEELVSLKNTLNETKSALNTFDLGKWHVHTKKVNPAGGVIWKICQFANPEYCSQAWCKLYEILSVYPVLLKEKEGHVSTVHLCEAPGAFVSALNHFIKTKRPDVKWDWLATTLNPHFEGNDVGHMINEDKLILNSYKHWTFLKDGTGNLLDQANLDYLLETVRNRLGSVDLVTADGGVDCSEDPAAQEFTLMELQLAEIVAAIHLLKEGGCFVLKIFTFFEAATVSHLYLLAALFKKVTLFKPATSKEGNSEIYAVCIDYEYPKRTELRHILNHLKQMVGTEYRDKGTIMIPTQKLQSGDFFSRVVLCAKFFYGYQIAVLKRNIMTFKQKKLKKTYKAYDELRWMVTNKWINFCKVSRLERDCKIFNLPSKGQTRSLTHVDPRVDSGSYADSLRQRNADDWTKLDDIENICMHYLQFGGQEWGFRSIQIPLVKLAFRFQHPYRNILSSRFCQGRLLSNRNKLRTLASNLARHVEVAAKACPQNHGLCQSLKNTLNMRFGLWNLHVVCFHEGLAEILFQDDLNSTAKYFGSLLSKFQILECEDSLFLCRMQLLSRLQLGLVCLLGRCFKQCHLVVSQEQSEDRGVLFSRYIGMEEKTVKNAIFNLCDIVKQLENVDSHRKPLELLPLHELLGINVYENIVKYNMFNVSQQMKEVIDELRELHVTPQSFTNFDQEG